MDIEPWLGTAAIVGTTLGAAIAGLVGGKKVAAKEPTQGDATVLAASIVPQGEMRALSERIDRLCALLEAEALHRHDEGIRKETRRELGKSN